MVFRSGDAAVETRKEKVMNLDQKLEAIAKALDKVQKKFPNGFNSWMETHHEVVEAITLNLSKERYEGEVKRRYDAQGRGGIWELSEELTDKFEKLNKDREWDGDYFDELEEFLTEELK